MPDQTDWAWLAGIVDGEGGIYIVNKTYRHEGRNHHHFNMTLRIYNTDEGILGKASVILGKNKLLRKRQMFWGKKPLYYIQINQMEQLLYILPKIIPFLASTKKIKAKSMENLLKLRKDKYYKHLPITKEEIELVHSIKGEK